MPIKKVSVTKTTSITVDGEKVDRERVVTLSEDWTERDILLFKKIVKQGGKVNIQGKKYICKPSEGVTRSNGFKDGGIEKMAGPEE